MLKSHRKQGENCLNPIKKLFGLCLLISLTACSTTESYNIVLQQTDSNPYLNIAPSSPYRIETVTELVTISSPGTVEIPYASSRSGYNWLLSKVNDGKPAQKSISYRVTYDYQGNILSKIEIPGSVAMIKAEPIVYQYGANVNLGSYFYARTISRYGFDCEGCSGEFASTSSSASMIRLSATAVRQSNGEWKDGITYDGYYIMAADQAFPLCTELTITNHHFSGSGIQVGVPFKALVIDRGWVITTNKLDFFIGSEFKLDTVVHNGNSAGTKVTVTGFLKWKSNSLGQMTCVK